MTKNPFYNSLAAFAYIIMIVFVVNWASNNQSLENSLLMPIIMLSLFTLSAAVMAYIFLYQPILLFLDKKKDEAIKLFLKTITIFGSITFTTILMYYLFISA
jgi:Na+/serine symporter